MLLQVWCFCVAQQGLPVTGTAESQLCWPCWKHGELMTLFLSVCLVNWEEEKDRAEQNAQGARVHLCSEGRVLKCTRGWVCGKAWCWGENGVINFERSLSKMWRKLEDRGRAHLCPLWPFSDFLCPIQGGNTLPARYSNSGKWSLMILEEFKTGNSVCQESDSLGVN